MIVIICIGTTPVYEMFHWIFPEVESSFYVQENVKKKLFVIMMSNKKFPSSTLKKNN